MRKILFSVMIVMLSMSSMASANDLSFLRNLSLGKNMYFLTSGEVLEALEDLNSIINKDVAMWIASMYDPDTGGFYYARSAVETAGFSADIESTYRAMSLIRSMGMFDEMPDEIRHKLIKFFQTRQDAATGYFYDIQFGKNVSDTKRSRNLTESVGGLNMLGALPLHPLPYDRSSGASQAHAPSNKQPETNSWRHTAVTVIEPRGGTVNSAGTSGMRQATARFRNDANIVRSSPSVAETHAAPVNVSNQSSHLPTYLTSATALRQWLESFDWENKPYSSGNQLSAARGEIVRLGLEDVVNEFIDGIQNVDTGLWGPGRTFEEVSAAMKLSGYYNSRPYPHAKKMLESVIFALQHEVPRQIYFVYNPLYLIKNVIISGTVGFDPEIDAILQENMIEIIRGTKDNLLRFKQPDKAFSYLERGSSPTSQGATVSLGLREADMNATRGANNTVDFLYEIVGIPRPTMSQYAAEFWDVVVNMESHDSIKLPVGLEENFENEGGTLSFWVAAGAPDVGNHKVVTDPHNPDNKVLKITKDTSGKALRVSSSFDPIKNADKVRVSYKFMVSEFDYSPAFNLYVGARAGHLNHALNFVIAKQDDTYFLSHRTGNRGTGTRISTITPDTWHHLEVEYEPAGIDDTKFTVYLDGELMAVMNEYYNYDDESKPPIRDIAYIEFHGYVSSVATLYIDDVIVDEPEK